MLTISSFVKRGPLMAFLFALCICGRCGDAAAQALPAAGAARRAGHLADARLTECSGIDVSTAAGNFLWALNDGGNGPFLYAMGFDGSALGRVRVEGADNRDWEAIDAFRLDGESMILIADVGDNRRRHATHTFYLVREPALADGGFAPTAAVPVYRRIVFAYPDGGHDAEAVAVDPDGGQILVLTKRDTPPLLFSVPLAPAAGAQPITARRIAAVDGIPPPTTDDMLQPYGRYRSQPTAMDLFPDGRGAVVLTYKHAYLFRRSPGAPWATAFTRPPRPIRLPLPETGIDFAQREALCVAPDGTSLYVTAEGSGAALFNVPLK